MPRYPGDFSPGPWENNSGDGEDSSLTGPAASRRDRDDDGLDCCGENRTCACICGAILLFISLILLALSFDVVKPTQYGLLQNGWTGVVYTDDNTYSPGRHFIWLRNFFITFPAYKVNIEFSSKPDADAKPVPARTGRDQNDPDSGGQPVTLSFSFQYQFNKDDVGKVYKEFGEQYEARFLLFARMAVSDVAQKYTPHVFWTDRNKVALDMEHTLATMLKKEGYVTVDDFQLLHVNFPDKYEAMITDIQLQVQYKLTSEYQQKVTDVYKDIDVLRAENDANITAIQATAQAEASVLVNGASMTGFYAQQKAKADAYAALQANLTLSNQELLDYVKIRSLFSRPSGPGKPANTVVGSSKPSLVN